MKATFQDYFREFIGPKEAEQFFSTIDLKPMGPRSIRVNTLKISKEALAEWFVSQGYEVKNSPYSADGLELTGSGVEWALKLPYHAGFTYPQDAASMFAVEVLNPQPGERVLDLTAAPGGKSTHIAQRMRNTGILVANDMDTHRIKALKSNLSRLGIVNAYVTRLNANKMAELYPETFDRILLDPSCSGEGLFVMKEGQPDYWNKKAVKHFAGLQFGLLRQAFLMLKPGGRILYSTCALNGIENDGVVADFLGKTPEAKIDGRISDELKKRDLQIPEQLAGLQGLRFWPHKTGTKGFFCIALTKTASQNSDKSVPSKFFLKVLSKDEREIYDQFLEERFGVSIKEYDLVPFEHHLFLTSPALKELPPPPGFSLSLPALKTYEGDEMKPSHEGVMFFAEKATRNIIQLTKEQMENAFKNQPVAFEGLAEGMYFARYLNFPLGLLKIGSHRTELLMPKMA
ncbi:MAG: RsmB/NOP family class I SAM-dependent RNA methyltransferase [Candidatus Gracilibacteria bacterium]